MEPTKVNELRTTPEPDANVFDMGRASEETKGGINQFESLNPPEVGNGG